MKKIVVVMLMFASITGVQANNLFQNDNPFPQTSPQTLNNIYESKPDVIQDEVKKEKKSWFRKGNNLKKDDEKVQTSQPRIPVYPVPHEGVQGIQGQDNFYMFTTGQ